MASEIGIDPFTVPGLRPQEFIRDAADAGFAAVSLRTIQPEAGSNPGPARVDEDSVDDVLATLAETGLRVIAVDIVDISRDADFAAIERGLRIAQRLGSPSVSIIAKSGDRASVSDGLGRLCDIALPLGISPRLEPISYVPLGTFAETVGIVAEHPGAGIMVDTLHLHRMGTDLDEVRRAAERFPITFQINGVSSRDELDRRHAAAAADEPNPLRWEAVWGRLLPGAGENDIAAVRDVLPPGLIPLVEAPDARSVAEVGARRHLADAFAAAQRALTTVHPVPSA